MADRLDHRRVPRYPLVLPFLHTRKGTPFFGGGVGWTRNLSEAGACVDLAEVLRPQTRLLVHLQTAHGAIEAEAEMAWAEERQPTLGRVRHGMSFTRFAPAQRQALRDLIQRPTAVRPQGVRVPRRLSVLCCPTREDRLAFQGQTEDVSRGGLCLFLPHRFPPTTMVEVTLSTPRGPLMAEATVAWVEESAERKRGAAMRHGLRFMSLGWTKELTLGFLLAVAT
jgi:hypothetical protein